MKDITLLRLITIENVGADEDGPQGYTNINTTHVSIKQDSIQILIRTGFARYLKNQI